MKTDPNKAATSNHNWFADLWEVESAKIAKEFAQSGIVVSRIQGTGRQDTPGETSLSFVHAPRPGSKDALDDSRHP